MNPHTLSDWQNGKWSRDNNLLLAKPSRHSCSYTYEGVIAALVRHLNRREIRIPRPVELRITDIMSLFKRDIL